MKKLIQILLITTLLVVLVYKAKAQTPGPKLDQLKLDKQFLGTWKAINGNEITTIECKLFYNGIETYFKTEKEGKIVVENKFLLGYYNLIESYDFYEQNIISAFKEIFIKQFEFVVKIYF